MKKGDGLFIIPIILLAGNFLYRLWDAAQLINIFPLDQTNDLSAYMALVHFFDIYGYLQLVPEWYNGFILFNTYAPGWVFFTWPIYKVTGDLLLGSYLSMILLFFLGFIAIYLIAKDQGISRIKTIAFFLFVYANPMIIGAVLKQGRYPALMGLVLLTYVFYFGLKYKNKKLDWKFAFFPLILAALILTHQAETILAGIFLLGLFFVKTNKERWIIILTGLLAVALSSFWLIQFFFSTQQTEFLNIGYGHWLLEFNSFFWSNVAITIITIGIFITFALYYKHHKRIGELKFWAPVLLLNTLLFFRVVSFIPILKYVYPDPYQDFFIFFMTFFLVKIDYRKTSKFLKQSFLVILALFAIAALLFNMFYTPFFQEHTEQDEAILTLIPEIDETYFFLITDDDTTIYSRAYYAYAAIYYGKETVSGWGDMYKEADYITALNGLHETYAESKDCNVFEWFKELGTDEIISTEDDCRYMVDACGLTLKASTSNVCLIEL